VVKLITSYACYPQVLVGGFISAVYKVMLLKLAYLPSRMYSAFLKCDT